MPVIIDSYPQRSEEWMAARAGNPGASNISKIITSTGQISKQREDYLFQLAGEQITGCCEEGYCSQAMQNGTEREDSARSLFGMIYGLEVRQVALVYKDEFKLFHCSPDGLPGDAVLELKCPMLKTQVRYLLDGRLPTDYFGQVQMSLYVTERELCYFMSFYAGMPPFILEVRRDEAFISKLAPALDDFAADLMKTVKRLRGLAEPEEACGKLATKEQVQRIQIIMKERGISERDVRIEELTSFCGRSICSTKDLTFEEADAFIKANIK